MVDGEGLSMPSSNYFFVLAIFLYTEKKERREGIENAFHIICLMFSLVSALDYRTIYKKIIMFWGREHLLYVLYVSVTIIMTQYTLQKYYVAQQ